jgi:hypothetical protein
MSQGYDANKPAYLDPLLSAPIRGNLNAVTTNHAGPLPPSDPETGWQWLDTSNALNYRIKMYVGGSWLTILNNIAAGFPSTSTTGKYTHTQAVASLTWSIAHALNTENITVQFWDSSKQLMIPDTVTIVSDVLAQATFLVAQSGTAVVVG